MELIEQCRPDRQSSFRIQGRFAKQNNQKEQCGAAEARARPVVLGGGEFGGFDGGTKISEAILKVVVDCTMVITTEYLYFQASPKLIKRAARERGATLTGIALLYCMYCTELRAIGGSLCHAPPASPD